MNKQNGLIKLIALIVILVVTLGLLRVDLRSIFENKAVRDNLLYLGQYLGKIWAFTVRIWLAYIKPLLADGWEKILALVGKSG